MGNTGTKSLTFDNCTRVAVTLLRGDVDRHDVGPDVADLTYIELSSSDIDGKLKALDHALCVVAPISLLANFCGIPIHSDITERDHICAPSQTFVTNRASTRKETYTPSSITVNGSRGSEMW